MAGINIKNVFVFRVVCLRAEVLRHASVSVKKIEMCRGKHGHGKRLPAGRQGHGHVIF